MDSSLQRVNALQPTDFLTDIQLQEQNAYLLDVIPIKDLVHIVNSFAAAPLAVGSVLQHLGSNGYWQKATVVEVKYDKVYVQYDGKCTKWDEWIEIPSARLALPNCYITFPAFNCKTRIFTVHVKRHKKRQKLMYSSDEYVANLGASAIVLQHSFSKEYFRTWTTTNPVQYVREANLIVPGQARTKEEQELMPMAGARINTVKKARLKHATGYWTLVLCVSGFVENEATQHLADTKEEVGEKTAELFAKASKVRRDKEFENRKPRISEFWQDNLPSFEDRQRYIDPEVMVQFAATRLDNALKNFLYTLWLPDIRASASIQVNWFSGDLYRSFPLIFYPENCIVKYMPSPRELFTVDEIKNTNWFRKRLNISSFDTVVNATSGIIRM